MDPGLPNGCELGGEFGRDHFWLVYTYQLNPPLGTAKTDVPLQSGPPYGYSGVHGQFDRSNLLWKMTVGVGGVCSLTSEVLVNLNKGVPPLAYFDCRGWFRAGLPFFRDDFEIGGPLLHNLTHPEYHITPEAAQRWIEILTSRGGFEDFHPWATHNLPPSPQPFRLTLVPRWVDATSAQRGGHAKLVIKLK
ncbi:hypothetical protein J6590_076715 [Homalodisca vitripennis]|nr:hypothetical protein J6590_076715 [Homalodisca vitripennis]